VRPPLDDNTAADAAAAAPHLRCSSHQTRSCSHLSPGPLLFLRSSPAFPAATTGASGADPPPGLRRAQRRRRVPTRYALPVIPPPLPSPPRRTRPSSPNPNAGFSYPDLTQPATRSAPDLRCFRCVNPSGTNSVRIRTVLSSIRPLNDFFPLTSCFRSRSTSKSRSPLGAWSTT
jgi:hypothetical protein